MAEGGIIKADVIVVGLGAAGVAALSRLHKSEIVAIGLEASSRLGGRIHTVPFGKNVVELGAEWCHGEKGNAVYFLAKDHNVIAKPKYKYRIDFGDSSGNLMPESLCNKLTDLQHRTMILAKKRAAHSSDSLGKIVRDSFYQILNGEEFSEIDPVLSAKFLSWMSKYENTIEACDSWLDVSSKGYNDYWECEGNQILHWKGKGYKTILDIMMKKYPNPEEELPLNIFTNKMVTHIIHSGEMATPKDILVECSDGSVYSAKHVVVTLPLGVLQERHSHIFVPHLPLDKIQTILGLSFGTVNKVFLMFEKPWWPKKSKWLGLLWDTKSHEVFSSGNDTWLLNVFGFNGGETQPNVLCGWAAGNAARYLETLPDDVVMNGLHRLLKHFFGNSHVIPKPAALLRSAWYSNQLARGSYSFRSIDSEMVGAKADMLATPLMDANGSPVLCFAGEATSKHFYSTVHGAIESGLREANRLINHLRPNSAVILPDIVDRDTEYSCVVVGAGIAGLSALRTLRLFGLNNVIVLEATNRIGGRILSIRGDKGCIELGAQWIHGEENKLKYFAERHGLLSPIKSSEGQGECRRNDGKKYSQETVEEIEDLVTNIMKKCEEFYQKGLSCTLSVGEFMESEFDKYVAKMTLEEAEVRRELFEWQKRFLLIDNSCDSLDELSAKSWGLYDYAGGDSQGHINFKNGFESVINELTEQIPRNSILKNSPVKTVEWSGDTVKLYINDTDYYESRHAIITIPLGVLKEKHDEMFEPSLPDKYVTAIESIGFGSVGKIFLQFSESWWDDLQGIQLTWKKNMTEEDNAIFRAGKSSEWIVYISGFDVLTVGPPDTLLGWVDSRGVAAMEKLSRKDIAADCHVLLESFLNRSIPKIEKVYRSKWCSNPHTRGSYSHITKACDDARVGPSTLAEPIYNSDNSPMILFAGEACHPTFFSTTHGAYDSGAQQAEVICSYLREMDED